MKLLSNPWIVALMGVVAMIVFVSQTIHFHWPHFHGSRPAPSASAPAPPTSPVRVNAANSAAHEPAPAIDRAFLESHLAAWMNAPVRDPFLQLDPVVPVSTNALLHQLNHLRLKAVWRQNGITRAAINRGIYGLGDEVEGCTVTRIDDNGVWLESNGQKQFLVFTSTREEESSPLTAPPK
jgi:hypothetical protein